MSIYILNSYNGDKKFEHEISNLEILGSVNQLSYKVLNHIQFFMMVKTCFLDFHSNAPQTYIHTYIYILFFFFLRIYIYIHTYIYIYIYSFIITTEVINSIFYVCKSLLFTPFYQCRNPNNCHAA